MANIEYSVVIPTYDRSKELIQTLNSLIKQDIEPDRYEILIVGEKSDKYTKEVLDKFIKTYPHFQIHYFECLKKTGPAAARNVALKKAKGDLIFFTSDDCLVPHNWIKKNAGYYKKYNFVGGVGGWYAPLSNILKNNIFEYYLHISIRLDFGFQMDYKEILNDDFFETPAGNGSNMSYKKHVLEEVGGFDEQMDYVGWTDWELKKRIMHRGYILLYTPTEVIHLSNMSLWNFIKTSFNRGRGRYHIMQKYPETFEKLNSIFNLKKIEKLSRMNPKLIVLYLLERVCIIVAKDFTRIKQFRKHLKK